MKTTNHMCKMTAHDTRHILQMASFLWLFLKKSKRRLLINDVSAPNCSSGTVTYMNSDEFSKQRKEISMTRRKLFSNHRG